MYFFVDPVGLEKTGLITRCCDSKHFSICHVADWAYMAVSTVTHVEEDEDNTASATYSAWLVDCDLAKKLLEDNAFFASALSGKKPDLSFTVTREDYSLLTVIRNEVRAGLRKPIADPQLDMYIKRIQTEKLKVFVDRYGEDPQFSPKKVWPGMLMLLLYPFGLPWFYFNKPLIGGIMLGCMAVCILLPVLIPFYGVAALVLMVKLIIQVLGNSVKDKNGYIICTQKSQKRILDSIARYKKNVAELEAYDRAEKEA